MVEIIFFYLLRRPIKNSLKWAKWALLRVRPDCWQQWINGLPTLTLDRSVQSLLDSLYKHHLLSFIPLLTAMSSFLWRGSPFIKAHYPTTSHWDNLPNVLPWNFNRNFECGGVIIDRSSLGMLESREPLASTILIGTNSAHYSIPTPWLLHIYLTLKIISTGE